MNLSEVFIRRPIMTSLVMVSIFLFGIGCYRLLPVSDLPSIEYPTIQVTTSYPGASPKTIADTVTSPLERLFTTIDGIEVIASSSGVGLSTIVLQFSLHKSIDIAAQDVQAAINQAMPNLPPDLPNFPTYQKTNPTQSPVMFLGILSDALPSGKVYEYAYSLIGQRISMLDGVSDVVIYGEPTAVRVQVDPHYLAAHHIGFDEVAKAIVQSNPQQPTGSLDDSHRDYLLQVDGQLRQAKDYNELIVRKHNQALLKVKTVGQAIESVKDDSYSLSYVTANKTLPCIALGVMKQSHANTLEVAEAVHQVLQDISPNLPQSIEIVPLLDQSTWIKQSVHDVQITLLIAIFLVVFVVLFYLGKVIDTFIPLIALPLSILGTFIFMFFYGFNIDILSLLAITLSVGFLVDDAIVVLENINRHSEMHETIWEATLTGSKEISTTVLAMTLCLSTIFFPMIFMPGVMGRLFREFSVTILTAVLLSGFISLSLTPMLCSRFLAPSSERSSQRKIEQIAHKIHATLLSWYQSALAWVFRHPILTLSAGISSTIATLILLFALPTNFLPDDDLGFIQGFGLASDSASSTSMLKHQNAISDAIKKDPNIEHIVAVSSVPATNQSLMFMRLKPAGKRKPIKEVVEDLLSKVGEIPGVSVFFRPLPLINLDVGTQTSRANYQYTLQSFDQKALYKSSQDLLHAMESSPTFQQVSSDLHDRATYVRVAIDRDRAYDLGVSADAIETMLNYAYSGGRLSLINGQANQYDVILETLPSASQNPSVLNQLYVTATSLMPLTGKVEGPSYPVQVPLRALAHWDIVNGPVAMQHINTLPSVTISYDIPSTIPLSEALGTLDQMAKTHLSDEVIALPVGSAKVFRSSLKTLALLFVITLFAIYVILGILYENLLHPITVMSALPPAALGAVLTLLIFREALSLYSLIGMMLLLGIVLKNGIMLIDFANTRLENGQGIEESMRNACQQRLRPILMTTFSAMMGAIPIALGMGGLAAQSRRPLGMVIIGGLMVSQVLTLFFTPTLFIFLERFRRKCHKKRS